MLLIIHNLPIDMGPFEVKELIQDKCNLNEVILDNFTNEGPRNKRVTVGLADEGDAALLVRKIHGLYINGHQLFVEDVRKKKSDQPFRSSEISDVHKSTMEAKSNYEQQNIPTIHQPPALPMMTTPMAYSNLPFYMSPTQNPYPNYENQSPVFNQPLSQVAFYQQPASDYGLQQSNLQKRLDQSAVITYPENPHQSRIDNTRNSSKERYSKPRESHEENRQDTCHSPTQRSRLRDDKNQSDSPRYKSIIRRSHEREPERDYRRYSQGNKRRRDESDDTSRRPSAQRGRDFEDNRYSNRGNRRHDDFKNKKHPSHVERSPPRDRVFERRGGRDRIFDQFEFHSQSDIFDRKRPCDEDERIRVMDDRERDHSSIQIEVSCGNNDIKWESSNKFQKINNQNKQPCQYDQRKEPYNYDQRHPVPKMLHQDSGLNQATNRTYSGDNKKGDMRNDKKPIDVLTLTTQSEEFLTQPFSKRPRINQEKSIQPGHDPYKQKIVPPTLKNFAQTRQTVILPSKKFLKRQKTLRVQSSGVLAKQIMKNSNATDDENYKYSIVYKKLKDCIVSRLDVLLGDKLVSSLPEMIDCYRSTFDFRDDPLFFKAVLEKLERDKKEAADKYSKDTGSIAAEEDSPQEKNVANAESPDIMPPASAGPKLKPPLSNNPISGPSAPKFQNRPVAPFQNRPAAPMIQNISTGPLNQYRPSAPLNQNRPGWSPNQNIQSGFIIQNRPSVSQNQNRPSAPLSQSRLSAPLNQSRLSAPLNQNRPSVPPIQNRPIMPQIKNRPSVPFNHIKPPLRPNQNRPSAPFIQNKPSIANPQSQVKGNTVTVDKPKGILSQITIPAKELQYMYSRKKISTQQKNIVKMEFEEEDPYPVTAIQKGAIEEEMNIIRELFVAPCKKVTDKIDARICERIINECADPFSKLVKLQITKRILNITTGLTVRVFSSPGWPRNELLRNYLSKLGVVRYQKNDNMVIATCGSYESYDVLLGMQSAELDKYTLLFKPLNIVGPRLTVRQMKRLKKKQNSQMQIQGDGEMFFDEADNDFEDLDYKTGDTSDIVLIDDNNKNVVVIEDDAPINDETVKSNKEAEAKTCEEQNDKKSELMLEENITETNTTCNIGDFKTSNEDLKPDNTITNENVAKAQPDDSVTTEVIDILDETDDIADEDLEDF